MEAMKSCTRNVAFGHDRLASSHGPQAALIEAQSRHAAWSAALACRARPYRCHRLRRQSPVRTETSLHSSAASSKESRTRDVCAAGANVQWTGPLPQGAAPEITTFNWIVDDIVAWTGETIMSSPGGGGVQTAFGARLAGCMCRLCCRVGDDFPISHREYMERMGVSLNLIHVPGNARTQASDGTRCIQCNGT